MSKWLKGPLRCLLVVRVKMFREVVGHLHPVLNVKNKYALETSKASEQSFRDVPAEKECCGGSFGTCKSKPKDNIHLKAGDNYHSRGVLLEPTH